MSSMTERWRSMFPGFRLRLTRWGGWFLVLTLILAFAAVNTGNNALIVVLGAVLASYILAGAWSREVLGRVAVSIRSPRETFADRPSLFEVELVNTGRVFPAYGLVVRAADGTIVVAQGRVGVGESVRRTVSWCFDGRGRRHIGPWRLEVVLPLGFFVKSKTVLEDQPVLVYPAPILGPVGRRDGDEVARAVERFKGRGREGEVFQLREFREGDDTRQVHWKQTARQQRMIAVDRRRAVDEPQIVWLDPVIGDPTDPVALALFETRVSAVTAAVLGRLEKSQPVVLAIGDTLYSPESRRSGARRLLEPLALIRPVGGSL